MRLELCRTSATQGRGAVRFCRVIKESIPNDGTYTWKVPNRGDDTYWPNKEQYWYKVRISVVSNDSAVFDFSDWFHINLNPNEPWILTAPDVTFCEDSDSDNRPDQLFFAWRSICSNPSACIEIPTLKLHLEAEHDTDLSQSFTVDHQMDYYSNYRFSLGPEILEDSSFTYRFTIEDASDPQVFDAYGPFKIDDPGPGPGGVGQVWWPVFQ